MRGSGKPTPLCFKKMNITNKHLEFIRLVANGENQVSAYRLTNTNKSLTAGTAKVNASKLAKKYAVLIEQEKEKLKSILDQARNNTVAQIAEMQIMTVAERMEVLSKIARGEIPLKKPMVCDGLIHEIDVVPDWMDRKNAIAELNKMDGSYAPAKQDVNILNIPAPIIDLSGK